MNIQETGDYVKMYEMIYSHSEAVKSCAPTCVKRKKFEIGKPDPAYLLPEQEEGEPSTETLTATHRKVYAACGQERETTTERSLPGS